MWPMETEEVTIYDGNGEPLYYLTVTWCDSVRIQVEAEDMVRIEVVSDAP